MKLALLEILAVSQSCMLVFCGFVHVGSFPGVHMNSWLEQDEMVEFTHREVVAASRENSTFVG